MDYHYYYFVYSVLFYSVFPRVAHAAPQNFRQLADSITGMITSIIPILSGAALLVFLWGIADFVRNAESSTGREEGKQRMVWGVVGLFVLLSLWGLVSFVGSSLGIPTR